VTPLCLAGPTASGKTGLAFAVAQALQKDVTVEVISVDSALIYCGMDIGTAKPTLTERAKVPHHLIDVLPPWERYSAAQFVMDTEKAVQEIVSRGHLPLLVGGTMLYFNAILQGLNEMPLIAQHIRDEVAFDLTRHGLTQLYMELQSVDPVIAQRLSPADTQRIVRALEVYRSSGRPLSEFHRPENRKINSWPLLSLEPSDRQWLHRRIEQRFTQMLQDGLVQEVQDLRQLPQIHADLPSMRCVGYRQVWEALDSQEMSSLQEKGVAATRQLAKRQLTWLRSMKHRHCLVCDHPTVTQQTIEWCKRQMKL
jgi:tRNA dimethylallyltransferase